MPEAEILPPEGAVVPFDTDVYFVSEWLPVPHPAGPLTLLRVREGLHLAWARTIDDRALLCLFAGNRGDLGFSSVVSADGIDRVITDLTSIRDQLRAR